MRVVAGSARGRRLEAPPGSGTRPTGDRVREALFNALGSLGAVRGAVVVDLFAGSGALGIEALSRGAAEAHLVESDRRAADVIVRNLERLGMADRAVVHRTSVERALRAGVLPETVGLVLVDPPYAFDGWGPLLRELSGRLGPDSVVVVESDRSVEVPAGWEKLRERTYGGTVVLFARPSGHGPGPEPGEPEPTGADA